MTKDMTTAEALAGQLRRAAKTLRSVERADLTLTDGPCVLDAQLTGSDLRPLASLLDDVARRMELGDPNGWVGIHTFALARAINEAVDSD